MSRSPSIPFDVVVAMQTDIGRKRKQNQDAIGHAVPPDPDALAELGQIFVLADGVGGLTGGDLASQYAVTTIISSYFDQTEGEPPERLARAIAEANNVIFSEGQNQEKPTIMATTVVAAVIRGNDLIIGSVGDSPAYLMRDADVRQLTLDHTVEALQREAGHPLQNGDPAGKKLARALGSLPSVKVDIISGRVKPGDHLVLCSDGLTRYLSPREIEQTVSTLPPQRAVETLIEFANERGGSDNVSAIVLRLTETGGATAPAPSVAPAAAAAEDEPPAPAPQPRRAAPPPAAAPRREPVPVAMPTHEPAENNPDDEPPAESPWAVLLAIARGNAVVTAAGMGVLLIAFVLIMLLIANLGGGGDEPPPTVDPGAMTNEASTAVALLAATDDALALQTQTVVGVTETAVAATQVVLSLTPPPNSGPQLRTGMWFQVLEGDPIPAYEDTSTDADEASELTPGDNYRVSEVNEEADNGYWYWVIDNLGQEPRWVNGPSLHQRIVVVDDSGSPLPANQQPLDLAPGEPTPTRAATLPPTRTPEGTMTPGGATPTPGEPEIAYGVESWTPGTVVAATLDLDLCASPTVTTCTAGAVAAGEAATISDGPTASGEHWWWEVEFADGRRGWIAQVLLSPA